MSSCRACGFDADAPVSAHWEFFVPVRAVSQNKLGSNKGGNRFTYKKLRTDYEWAVLSEMRRRRVPRATKFRRIHFVRHFSQREGECAFDRGNLVGGLKPLLDACKRQGLLVDDSPKWCLDFYDQQPHDALVGVLVRIEELA